MNTSPPTVALDGGELSAPTAVVASIGASLATELTALESHRSADVRSRLEAARQIEATALAAGETEAAMRARLVTADMLQRIGEGATGVQLAAEVQAWAAGAGARSVLARSHLVLSTMFEGIGDPPSSLDHAVQAMDLLPQDAPTNVRGRFVMRLADALAYAELIQQARRRYTEAQDLFRACGDRERLLILLNNLAVLETDLGEPTAAAAAADELERQAGADDMNPDFAETIARARLVAGDLEAAERSARAGHELLAVQGDTTAVAPAEMSMTLAEILLASGRLDEAQNELDRCAEVCRQRNLGGFATRVKEVQARLYAAAGEYEQAYHAHRDFHAAATALHSRQSEAAARSREALFRTTEARREADQFRLQARVDPLTDLYNRRFVDETLPSWLAEVSANTDLSLTVALVDLDFFKLVNDQYSHAVGDQVIHLVARAFARAVGTRTDAFVARIGGEEFLVADRSRRPSAVAQLIERLRLDLATRDWTSVAPRLRVTVSAGVAMAAPGDTVRTLLERADQQLYAAKAAGRNRVVAETAITDA